MKKKKKKYHMKKKKTGNQPQPDSLTAGSRTRRQDSHASIPASPPQAGDPAAGHDAGSPSLTAGSHDASGP